MNATPTGRRPWTLRRRLTVSVVVLIAVISLTVAAVSTLALRQSLMERLHGQVDELAHGPLLGAPITGGAPRPGAIDQPPPQPVGSVVLVVADGVVLQALASDEQGVGRTLTAEQIAALTAATSARPEPSTVRVPGLGDYVVARDDRGAQTVIAGLATSEVDAATASLATIFAVVTLGAIALGAFGASLLVGRVLRPLDRVAATAREVAARSLDRGDVRLPERVPARDTDPRTEVGQVGSSLNLLLDRVEDALSARQRSETQLRRFVADASHELRTPLASIRGYTELTRRESERLSDDQRHSMQRIDAESRRMATLVEDLLLLARLDAGAAVQRSDSVDLVHVVADAVSDAMAAGRSHEWRLDLAAASGDPGDQPGDDQPGDDPSEHLDLVVRADPHGLHQIIANLLGNARTHTPAGTTVTVSVGSEGDNAVVTVADNGPGIDPALVPVIFERFVRGDEARSRSIGAKGSGLGLPIARALAQTQGGDLTVVSAPGSTQFTLRLPLAAPQNPPKATDRGV